VPTPPGGPERLPSLNALLAFEAAARAESFTRAAQELHVTQGAVSRLIRALEQELGTRLFLRSPTGVSLTAEGARFAREVAESFGRLRQAAAALRGEGPALVRVGLLASFATHWLMPRLAGFEAARPDVEVELWPDYRTSAPGRDGLDLTVRYGRGLWTDGRVEPLVRERLVPVASPGAVRRCGGRPPLDVLPLLSSSRSAHGPDGELDWRAWAEAAGVALPGQGRWRWVRDYGLAVAGALAGAGAAVGRLALVGPLLAEGRLVALSPRVAEGPVGHYLVLPDAPLSLAAEAFAAWLRAEAARP
jgi:LysR family glycine cleavage system transcriptional activator